MYLNTVFKYNEFKYCPALIMYTEEFRLYKVIFVNYSYRVISASNFLTN